MGELGSRGAVVVVVVVAVENGRARLHNARAGILFRLYGIHMYSAGVRGLGFLKYLNFLVGKGGCVRMGRVCRSNVFCKNFC